MLRNKLKRFKEKLLSNSLGGTCHICGESTIFEVPEIENVDHVRESMYCVRCRGKSRERHVAKIILGLFAHQYNSLVQARQILAGISIYNTVSTGALNRVLKENNSNFVCSELFPDLKEGDLVNGVYCQNLEHLTFKDEQFNLVITEDVLEHVRYPEAAFKEIRRVLKLGGYHIFTIPFHADKKTVQRVNPETGDYLLPADYHVDASGNRVLVYTDWGYDIYEKLDKAGFETRISMSGYRDAILYGIADSMVFFSQKI